MVGARFIAPVVMAIPSGVMMTSGKRRGISTGSDKSDPYGSFKLLVLSVFLYCSAFPNVFFIKGFFITGWLFAVPFFLALENANWLRRTFIGFMWGLAAHGLLIWWLLPVSAAGYVLFVAALALQGAVAGILLGPVLYSRAAAAPFSWSRTFYIPSAWVVSEYVRNMVLGGFTWSAGYSQAFAPEFLPPARLGGVYAVCWLMMAVNAGVYHAFKDRQGKWGWRKAALLSLGAPLALWIIGAIILATAVVPVGKAVRVVAVQANMTRAEKTDPKHYDQNATRHLILTKRSAFERRPDIVIWPETAFPDDILRDPVWRPRMEQAARNFGSDLVVGSALLTAQGKDANALLWLGRDGVWKDVYLKKHLVPFTEYHPSDLWAQALMRRAGLTGNDFVVGQRAGTFDISSVPVILGVALCSEEGYPALFRDLAGRGAGVLAVALNDGWFGRPEALMMHGAMGILRAVETGRPLVRAANSGWTMAVDDRGRVSRGSPALQHPAFGCFDMIPASGETLYVRFGDLFALLCAGFVIIGALWKLARPK